MAGGRPKNYTDEQVEQIRQSMQEYINQTPIPILAEFAYLHNIPRYTLYDYDEFSTLIKRMIDKKEAQLERKCLNGEIDKTMAIFSLKQLGWKDKMETEHSGNLGISIIDDVVKCQKSK